MLGSTPRRSFARRSFDWQPVSGATGSSYLPGLVMLVLALGAIVGAITLLPTREPGAKSPWPAVSLPHADPAPAAVTVTERSPPKAVETPPQAVEPEADSTPVMAEPRVLEKQQAPAVARRVDEAAPRDYRDLRRYWLDAN